MSEVENYWDFMFCVDAENRKWVKFIDGEGDTICISNGAFSPYIVWGSDIFESNKECILYELTI